MLLHSSDRKVYACLEEELAALTDYATEIFLLYKGLDLKSHKYFYVTESW